MHSEQTFGNVEPALSLDKVRKIELDADKREAAAIRIQAYERGRQTRSKRHLSAQQPATEETTKDNADTASRRTMGKVVTTREEALAAATKIQSVQRGRLARGVAARAKADLARYRKEMGRIAHDVDVADRADRAAASTAADAAADAAAATAAAVAADAADANAAEAAAAGQGSEERP